MRKRDILEMVGLMKFVFGLFVAFLMGWIGGWQGAVLTMLLVLVVLFIASQFLFVLYGLDDRLTAFKTLLTFIFGLNYPYQIVENGQVEERSRGSPLSRIGGPGLVVIRSGNAVLFERGGKFTRVEEPGIVFTERFEHIREVVDLRLQVKSQKVHALTKDGIPVDIDAMVFFKIDSGGAAPTSENPHPFSEEAVFKAVYNKGVDSGEDLKWDEIIIAITAARLRDIVARYYLDKMYEPSDQTADPRSSIKEELLKEVKRAAPSFGVEIEGVNIGTIQVPEEARQQLLAAWQAEWQRQIELANAANAQKVARIMAETTKIMAKARAKCIDTIFETIREQAGTVTDAYVALRYIEALERMSAGETALITAIDSASDLIDAGREKKEDASGHLTASKG